MLELKNIGKTFNPGTVNEKIALEGVNLHLDDGDFATIVGSNGAGKSTLFNAIAGRVHRRHRHHHAGRAKISPFCQTTSAPRPSVGCSRTRCAARPRI